MFNLLKLGELQTDKDDRPIFDAKIISCEVLSNPFDDIVPRTTPEERLALKRQKEREEKARSEAGKPKGTKYDLKNSISQLYIGLISTAP